MSNPKAFAFTPSSVSSLTGVTRAHSEMSNISSSNNSNSVWDDEMGASSDQLFFVTSYSDFDKLAHGPKGTQAKAPLSVYRFHPSDGSLVLLNVQGDPSDVINPAFSRYHPRLNVVYTCTEDIENNGKVFAYSVGPAGELTQLGDSVDAGGTSTCYLTIDRVQRHMLCVNYWDSTLSVIPISPETGEFTGPIRNMYDPKDGKKVVAAGRAKGGVNHSNNDDSTISMRQADPHSHALVLDPFVGCVAYVPDLGKDLIREFLYCQDEGKILMELNVLPSGLCTGKPDGPRYFQFHPRYPIAYCVNELSSTVAVFEVDKNLLMELQEARANHEDLSRFKGRSSLRLIQSIKTLPSAFPTIMNTCGRICVHKSGRFVVVSNRGHQSIAVFRVHTKGGNKGELSAIGYFHTRGETPRHFQFDASGQYLLVANQDTDSLAVFHFNLCSGEIRYTGNEYRIASPNFVCCCPMRDGDDDVPPMEAPTSTVPTKTVSDLSNEVSRVVPSTVRSGSVASDDTGDESSDVSVTWLQPKTQNSDPTALMEELARAREEIANLKLRLQETQDQPTA